MGHERQFISRRSNYDLQRLINFLDDIKRTLMNTPPHTKYNDDSLFESRQFPVGSARQKRSHICDRVANGIVLQLQ